MGLVVSSGFANQVITFLEKRTVINDNDYTVDTTWVPGKSYQACIYSKSLGMDKYSIGLWKENTEYVAMIDYVPDDLDVHGRIRFDNVDYQIDYIDDIAFQHEAIFIGLSALK